MLAVALTTERASNVLNGAGVALRDPLVRSKPRHSRVWIAGSKKARNACRKLGAHVTYFANTMEFFESMWTTLHAPSGESLPELVIIDADSNFFEKLALAEALRWDGCAVPIALITRDPAIDETDFDLTEDTRILNNPTRRVFWGILNHDFSTHSSAPTSDTAFCGPSQGS